MLFFYFICLNLFFVYVLKFCIYNKFNILEYYKILDIVFFLFLWMDRVEVFYLGRSLVVYGYRLNFVKYNNILN